MRKGKREEVGQRREGREDIKRRGRGKRVAGMGLVRGDKGETKSGRGWTRADKGG